jgi:3-dehydroquinate dehydratase/shikimate dehydrogenase
MGDYGFPSRVLASRLNSYLTFTQPGETAANAVTLGQIDPVTLNDLYGFRTITEKTAIYGIIGYPLQSTLSPFYHNVGYRKHGIDAVYIPIKARHFDNALKFADLLKIRGLSVTVPHKETALDCVTEVGHSAREIGACNTLVRSSDGEGWVGYDTDAVGLIRSLQDFLGKKNLSRMKVSIIGAGGAAKAAAFAVASLKGKACIFNRTVARAKKIALQYHFKWASLGAESNAALEAHSDLIIQTTSVGMKGVEGPDSDPLYFYLFTGKEAVYDIIYTPEVTPLLARAKKAGCKTSNGRSMLNYQAFEQFHIFTGETY